jgi:hypothetical protein
LHRTEKLARRAGFRQIDNRIGDLGSGRGFLICLSAEKTTGTAEPVHRAFYAVPAAGKA